MGIVAKIDLAEIQSPFVRAGLMAGSVAVVVVILGAMLFIRVTDPLLKNLQESEGLLRRVLETLPVGVWIADKDGTIEHGNPAGQHHS